MLLALLVGAALAAQVGDAPPLPDDPDELRDFEPAREPEPQKEPPASSPSSSPTTDLRVRLVYSPGPWTSSCPSLDDVRTSIQEHLGYDPFAEPATRVVLLLLDTTTGTDEPHPDRARVELLDQQLRSLGTRSVTSPEGCAELVATAALQVSIAVDPTHSGGPRPIERRDVVDPAAPTGAEQTPPQKDPPASPPAAPAAPIVVEKLDLPPGFFGVDGHLAGLLTPTPFMFGASGYAGFRWDWLSARAELRIDFPGDQSATTTMPVLLTGAPCMHLPIITTGPDERVEMLGCATASTGVVPAFGLYNGIQVYAGIGGRVGLDWRFSDASSVRGFFQMEGALLRPEFDSDSTGNSYTSPPINVMAGVGVDLPSL